MPEGGAGGSAGPRLALRRVAQVAHVEWLGGHQQLAVAGSPAAARSVGVDLDAQTVGVAEVERLADQVVPHAGALAEGVQVRQETAERTAVGQEDGEVVETEPPARRHWPGVARLTELDDRRVVAVRAEDRSSRRLVDEAQPEDVPVVRERAVEIGDLKDDATETRRGRESKAGRSDAVGECWGQGGCRRSPRTPGQRVGSASRPRRPAPVNVQDTSSRYSKKPSSSRARPQSSSQSALAPSAPRGAGSALPRDALSTARSSAQTAAGS